MEISQCFKKKVGLFFMLVKIEWEIGLGQQMQSSRVVNHSESKIALLLKIITRNGAVNISVLDYILTVWFSGIVTYIAIIKNECLINIEWFQVLFYFISHILQLKFAEQFVQLGSQSVAELVS